MRSMLPIRPATVLSALALALGLALLPLGTPTANADPVTAVPEIERVDMSLLLARTITKRAAAETSDTRKLQLHERSLVSLRAELKRLAKLAPKDLLVLQTKLETAAIGALNAQTRIYLARRSLSQAQETSAEALAFRTVSLDALILSAEVKTAAATDTFADLGLTALERLRAVRDSRGPSVRGRSQRR